MNKGLSPELILAFPIISPIILESESNNKLEPNWVAGFASGEGSFQVDKRISNKHGHQILLRFSIGQHRRDEQLLRNLIYYLDCGKVNKKTNKNKNKKNLKKIVQNFLNFELKNLKTLIKKLFHFLLIILL